MISRKENWRSILWTVKLSDHKKEVKFCSTWWKWDDRCFCATFLQIEIVSQISCLVAMTAELCCGTVSMDIVSLPLDSIPLKASVFASQLSHRVKGRISTARLGFRFGVRLGFQTLWLYSIMQNMFPLTQIHIWIPFPYYLHSTEICVRVWIWIRVRQWK